MVQTKEQKREKDREYYQRNKEDRKHYQLVRRYQRKNDGLCVDCGSQARSGKTRCQQCYDYNLKLRIKERQTRKHKAVKYLGCKCIDCGLQTDFISVYEFHHKDADTKNEDIATLLNHRKSWETVQTELDKCILLCANCHRIRHELEERRDIGRLALQTVGTPP